MAGPGDEIAAGAGGHGHLRASDADREQVISVLKAAFVQGLLAKDEFDRKVGQAFVSRTYAELAALTADIPTELTGAQRSPEPRPESADRKAVKAIACATAALWGMFAVAAMAAAAAQDGGPLGGLIVAVVFIPFLVIPVAALLLFHAWLERRADKRQRSQGLPPGADGQASQRPVSADPARQLPQIRPGPRHTAEAGPIRRPCPPLSGWRAPHRWRPLGRRYAIGCPGH
jgi:Domain of unknown function (DUF1707)